MTGKAPVYVIGTMWDGGNVEHYAPSHPRVLVDGKPARAPWIDLNDLRARGAVVVWTSGDTHVIPPEFRTIAADAAVQPPFVLDDLRGGNKTKSAGRSCCRDRVMRSPSSCPGLPRASTIRHREAMRY